MTGNEHWLSTKTAAEELGLVSRTLYRLINNGELPAYRFGRVIRIKRKDLDQFIDANQLRPGDLNHLEQRNPDPDDDE